MKILVIGAGGREHAIAWKLLQSPKLSQLYVSPGNGGTALLARSQNVIVKDYASFCHERAIDLVVVGPEQPLADGISDDLRAKGIKVFGPSRAAAQLEASKAFAKTFMRKYDIPTAKAEHFRDAQAAIAYVHSLGGARHCVIKASGLAAGKGVIISDSDEEAEEAIRSILIDKRFAEAGDVVIIEDRLVGEEFSVLAFCDGTSLGIMPCAQDHKRAFDGDRGPNTGGMGAYAPAPIASPELVDEVRKRVLEPAVYGMAREGRPYVGVLYAGMMETETGPMTLEFNCRFGDPESQAI